MVELFKHDLLMKFCRGKAVVHVGAVDSPYHLKRGVTEELLHQKLGNVSKSLIGIDKDKTAIKQVKEKFGIKNIYYGDILDGEYDVDLSRKKFDFYCIGGHNRTSRQSGKMYRKHKEIDGKRYFHNSDYSECIFIR